MAIQSFQVNSVNTGEKYNCVVHAVAGDASFTNVANVFGKCSTLMMNAHLVYPISATSGLELSVGGHMF